MAEVIDSSVKGFLTKLRTLLIGKNELSAIEVSSHRLHRQKSPAVQLFPCSQK